MLVSGSELLKRQKMQYFKFNFAKRLEKNRKTYYNNDKIRNLLSKNAILKFKKFKNAYFGN